MKYEIQRFSDLSHRLWKSVSSLTVPDSGLVRYYNYYLDALDENNKKRIHKNDLGIILVRDPDSNSSKLNEDLCAWAMVGLDQDFYDGNSAVIYVFIKKSHRSKGIGFNLFEKSLEVCKKEGFKKFNVYAHDEASRKFFSQEKIVNLVKSSGLMMEVIES